MTAKIAMMEIEWSKQQCSHFHLAMTSSSLVKMETVSMWKGLDIKDVETCGKFPYSLKLSDFSEILNFRT